MATNNQDALALGFLENADSWALQSKFFTSKVGGNPSWLALEDLPSPQDLLCKSCNNPMIFLCQVYMPDESKDYAFHRTLFVFVCQEGKCNGAHYSKTMKVFRSQLPRHNKYYSSDPPVEEEETSHSPSAADFCNLCATCGAVGDKACAQCSKVHYCCRIHQAIHWKSEHKAMCKEMKENDENVKPTCYKNPLLFPESALLLEPVSNDSDRESEGSDSECDESEFEREVRKAKKQFPGINIEVDTSKGKDDGLDELEKVANKESDPSYMKFETIMAEEPDQIIRYEKGGQPLYCSEKYQITAKDIKNCLHCNKKRRFEFQILPQMLNHLKIDLVNTASLDWGVLFIYSCWCDSPLRYTQEQIFKQNYSPDDNVAHAEDFRGIK